MATKRYKELPSYLKKPTENFVRPQGVYDKVQTQWEEEKKRVEAPSFSNQYKELADFRNNEVKQNQLPMLKAQIPQEDLYAQYKELADFRNQELKNNEIKRNRINTINKKPLYDVDDSNSMTSTKLNPITGKNENVIAYNSVNNFGNVDNIKNSNVKGKSNFVDDTKDVAKSLYVGASQMSNSLYKIADLLYTGGAKATDLLLPKSVYDIDKDNLYQGAHKKLQNVMNSIEKQNEGLRESYKDDKGLGKKILTTAGEAIPAIVATMFTGAGLAKAYSSTAPLMEGLLSTATKTNIIRMLPFGVQASGGYARESELDGATYEQQVMYGIAGGLAETVTEAPMMTKWIDMFGKKTMQSMMHKGGKELAKNLGKVGIDWLTNIAGETLQEAAVEPMTGYAKKAIYQPDKPIYGDGGVIDVNAIKEAGFGGFSMAVVLGAFGLPSTYASHKMATKYAKDGTEMTQEDFNTLNEQFEKDIQSLNENDISTIEKEAPEYLNLLRAAEEEDYQNQNDIMANGEFDNAQMLAETANVLETIPQENPIMEEVKQKVIQRNRETANQVLATVQTDNNVTKIEPTEQTINDSNTINPIDINVPQNANSEVLSNDESDLIDTADYNNDISNSNEIKAVKVKSIGVDPQRFQFKADTDFQTGAGQKLSGTEKFDKNKAGVVTVWQDNQGKAWVINGHHRVELANRTNTDTMNAIVLKESDGISDKQAREIGALQNIGEGMGTPKDAAQIFREGNYTLEDIKDSGLSLKDKFVDQGYNIAQLNDRLYHHVVNENLSYDKASMIGKEFPKGTQEAEANQNAVMDYIQQNNPNKNELSEAIYMIKASEAGLIDDIAENEQMSLDGLGTSNVMGNNFADKMKLISELKHTLVSDKNIFNKAIKKSGVLSEAGNVLNTEGNSKRKELLDNVLKVIDQGKGKKGDPINDILNTYASKVGFEGMKIKSAVDHATNDIIDYISNNNIAEKVNTVNNEDDGQIDLFGGLENGNVEQRKDTVSNEVKGNQPEGAGESTESTAGEGTKEIGSNTPIETKDTADKSVYGKNTPEYKKFTQAYEKVSEWATKGDFSKKDRAISGLRDIKRFIDGNGKIQDVAIGYWKLNNWFEDDIFINKDRINEPLSSIKEFLDVNSIEIKDLTRETYTSELAVEVNYIMNNDGSRSKEKPRDGVDRIFDMVKPIILQKGSVIQPGQVILENKTKLKDTVEESPIEETKEIPTLTEPWNTKEPFNAEMVRTANNNSGFTDYNYNKEFVDGVAGKQKEIADLVEKYKDAPGINDISHTLNTALNTFKKDLYNQMVKIISAKASFVSPMVAGRSNYNVKKGNQTADRIAARSAELTPIYDKFKNTFNEAKKTLEAPAKESKENARMERIVNSKVGDYALDASMGGLYKIIRVNKKTLTLQFSTYTEARPFSLITEVFTRDMMKKNIEKQIVEGKEVDKALLDDFKEELSNKTSDIILQSTNERLKAMSYSEAIIKDFDKLLFEATTINKGNVEKLTIEDINSIKYPTVRINNVSEVLRKLRNLKGTKGFTEKIKNSGAADDPRFIDLKTAEKLLTLLPEMNKDKVFTESLSTVKRIEKAGFDDVNSLRKALTEAYAPEIEKNEGAKAPVEESKKLPILGEKKEVKETTKNTEPATPIEHYKKITTFNTKVKKGDVTAQEVKDQFEYLISNETIIRDGIFNALKTNEKYKGKRKTTLDKYVDELYDRYIERLIYVDKDSYSMVLDFSQNSKNNRLEGKRNLINAITDESINSYWENKKAKYEAEKAKTEKSLNNPETLEEFRLKKEQKGLSAEEERTYEDLIAKRQNERADNKAEDKRTKKVEAISNINDMFEEPIKDVNTKTNEDLWVVKFKGRVDKETYISINSEIKKLGGYYSSFKKGFIFKEEPSAKLQLLKDGGTFTKEKIDNSKDIADKLRTLADNMQNEIDNCFADRLENTARRAGMAANTRAYGDSLKSTQTIMRKIAGAIEKGEAEHLKGITARTHIKTLQSLLSRSNRAYIEKTVAEKYPNDNYMQEKYRKEIKGQEVTIEAIDNAEYPKMSIYSRNLENLVKFTKELKGFINLSSKYAKLAEKNTGERININDTELKEIESLIKIAQEKGIRSYDVPTINWVDDYKRLNAMGIETIQQLRAALREFLPHTKGTGATAEELKQREIRSKETELASRKIEGYFPTPKKIVERMLDEANIQSGDKVLEPSAGAGHIADSIKEQYSENKLEVVEYNISLNELLKDKGHNVVNNDFLKHTGEYDKIIMNPPFEKGQDVDHVNYAYELLKPGGKIVAIMSEHPFFANDKKSIEFREWLDEVGTSEKLDQGSFMESDRKTGVNTRIVVIDKPASEEYKLIENPEEISQKQFYHGTGTPGLKATELDFTATEIEGLFGSGIYLTDNLDIAQGYAKARSKKTKTPVVYNANVKVDKVLNLEKTMPDDAYGIFKNIATSITKGFEGDFSLMEKLHSQGASGKEIYKEFQESIAEVSSQNEIPKSEFYDYIYDLNIGLKELGYDAYTHIGGTKTNNKPHQVLIMLDPNDMISQTGRNGQITKFEQIKDEVPAHLQGHTSNLESKQSGPNPDMFKFNKKRTNKDVQANNAEYFSFSDEEVEGRHKASNGLSKKSFLTKVKEGIIEFKNMSTRTFRNIEPNVKNAEFIKEMVQYPKLKNLSADETVRILDDITYSLDDVTYNNFSKKVLLDDLMEEVKSKHSLPLGFTKEIIERDLKAINNEKYLTKEVKEAISKRNKYWDSVKNGYIEAMQTLGIDVSEKFTRENYFRHQVLDYMEAKKVLGTGNKMKVATNRGFSRVRHGYEGDINTNYLQAEYEVMAQMIHDKDVAELIIRVKNNYDMSETLKKEAKALREQEKAAGNETKIKWQDLLPDGYTLWQPREGNVFYFADSLPSKITDELMNGLVEEIGVKREDFKKILAQGGKYKEYALPAEIAEKLNELYKNNDKNVVSRLSKKILSSWKQWVLTVNPHQVIKYNIRNITGDFDAVMLEPGITKYSMRAARELYSAMKSGTFTKDLIEWRDRGGFEDLTIPQEIATINKLEQFKRFDNKKELPNPLKSYTDATSNMTNYRESILRYAAYLHYKKVVESGKVTYGASNPALVKGLKTTEDKAYKLSKDLLGAYDEISETGQILREHWIPFYSWIEVNFKRYTQSFANAANKDIALEQLISNNKNTNGINLVAQIGKNLGTTSLRAIFLTAALALWNFLKHDDEEELLPKSARETPHIILGTDKNGKVVYFNRLGAFSDYLDWFGLDNIAQDVSDIQKGRKTVKEQLLDSAMSPVNKFANGITPFIKVPVELITGKKAYPEMFNPSTIRNKPQHLAQSLGLGSEYNKLAGIPTQGGLQEDLQTAVIYKSDPKAAAYNNTLDIKRNFEKQRGKEPTSNYATTPKSNALYYYKLSLKYNDAKAADKWIKKYVELGGDEKSLDKSLDMLNPLYGYIPTDYEKAHPKYKDVAPKIAEKKKTYDEFMSSLTPKEKDQLSLAIKYYDELVKASKKQLPMLKSNKK